MLGIFLKLSVVSLLGAMSPGPDLLIVARSSLTAGRRYGLAAAGGLAAGVLVHSTYCIFGLALLLQESPTAQQVIEVGGAIYLTYLGIQRLRGNGAPVALPDGAFVSSAASSPRAAFVRGLTNNLLNPKATLFILSVFSQLVEPGTPRALQALMALDLAAITLVWFSLLACGIGWAPLRSSLLRWQKTMDRAFGVVLIGLAAVILMHT